MLSASMLAPPRAPDCHWLECPSLEDASITLSLYVRSEDDCYCQLESNLLSRVPSSEVREPKEYATLCNLSSMKASGIWYVLTRALKPRYEFGRSGRSNGANLLEISGRIGIRAFAKPYKMRKSHERSFPRPSTVDAATTEPGNLPVFFQLCFGAKADVRYLSSIQMIVFGC